MDEFSKLLIPSGYLIQWTDANPVKSPGDGNCLFHAISISIEGNVTLVQQLLEITAIELYENAAVYVERIIETASHNPA